MDRMISLSVVILVLMQAAPVHAEPDRWGGTIAEASHRFGIPEPWIRAVIKAESGGRTMRDGRPITSRAGAMGPMQVMPDTYDEMRRIHHLGPDAHEPHDNILAGTAYLRAMFDRYGYPGLFAAYNAGPERYGQSLRGRPFPEETRLYLATVAESRPLPPSGTRLFVTLRTVPDALPDIDKAPASNRLFIPLTAAPGGGR